MLTKKVVSLIERAEAFVLEQFFQLIHNRAHDVLVYTSVFFIGTAIFVVKTATAGAGIILVSIHVQFQFQLVTS